MRHVTVIAVLLFLFLFLLLFLVKTPIYYRRRFSIPDTAQKDIEKE